jgi:hypothetical protein
MFKALERALNSSGATNEANPEQDGLSEEEPEPIVTGFRYSRRKGGR